MHQCDGQTDERAIAYSALSMLSRANNVWSNKNATQAALSTDTYIQQRTLNSAAIKYKLLSLCDF